MNEVTLPPPPFPPSTSSHWYFFITLNLIKQSNFYVKMFFHSNHSITCMVVNLENTRM